MMFQTTRTSANRRTVFGTLDLVFHAAVHNIRKTHRNALAGLVLNIAQNAILLATFFLMFNFLGVRGTAIRGDFMLYLMSGIFLFMVHVKAVSAIAKAEGPTSSMMQHAPLTTFVTIGAAALGSLYLQVLSMFVILFLYHVLWTPIVIDDPVGALAMLLLSWLSGVGVGIVFFSLRPWSPEAVTISSTVYSRLNMVFSGKMFVANTLPGYMLAMFDWNPLFHAIDQARGFIFINYNPHFSSPTYPIWISIGLIMVGLLIESYTRRHASLSWSAGR
jgi:ABC-type polysaccharide/polyol phosphate export permease